MPTIRNTSNAPAPTIKLDVVSEPDRGPHGIRVALFAIDAQAIVATPFATAHLPRLVDQGTEQQCHMPTVLHEMLGMPLHAHKEAAILRLHAFHQAIRPICGSRQIGRQRTNALMVHGIHRSGIATQDLPELA